MKLNNGNENVTAKLENFEMTSASRTKIELPYNGEITGEMALQILHAACDTFDNPEEIENAPYYEQVVKSAGINIRFNIQSRNICSTAIANIETTNGRTTQAKLRLDFTDNELIGILDRFFDGGGKGLKPNHKRYFENTYKEWKERIGRAA